MRHLFSIAASAVVSEFAARRTLLAFDFDGTLAPIVDQPDAAAMRPRTQALLGEVARRYPVVVISGRAQDDVLRRLAQIPVLEVVGNHGLEPNPFADRFANAVQRWLPLLTERLAGVQGVVIEDKRLSVALHYRASLDQKRALEAIEQTLPLLGPLRVVGGKKVVNLVPEGGQHKGTALQQLQQKLDCEASLFVGDDVTDEDVFAMRSLSLLTIRVGQKRDSQAEFFLRDQLEIDALLQLLAESRPLAV